MGNLSYQVLFSAGVINLSPRKPLYECCYCGQGIRNEGHLHEIVISRGDVQGLPVAGVAIMDRRNCGFIHPGCHPLAEGGEGKVRAIKYLIAYEGLSNILDFIQEMSLILKRPMTEFTSLVWKAYEEMVL